MGRETENEDWKGSETTKRLKSLDAIKVDVVVTHLWIEGVLYSDHHNVNDRQET